MERTAPRLGSAIALATVMLWAPQARATLTLYNSNCVGCHSAATTTCDGCHAHGVHSSSAKTDINLGGTTDKATYAPGSTVKVTVNAGYSGGWVRVVLFDQNLKELARSSCPGGVGGCTTSKFPITLTAPAPMTAGTYIWAVAWYGNNYDISGASFGSGNSSTLKVGFFTADANNLNHGYQTIALPAFSVSAASAPAIVLNPNSLNFGTVTVGSPKTLTAQVQNTGTAPLNVTSVSSCAGTPSSITRTPPGPFTVAAGGSASLSVTFAPTTAGALPAGACLALASNDPAKPTLSLGLAGTGTNTPAPAIVLNPTSLNFQMVTVGSSKTLSTQVQNTGTAPLNVTSVSSCAGTPSSITRTPTGPFTVAAGGSASLSVTFAPTAAGALPAGACLAVASNDPAKPTVNLGVSGTATTTAAPAIALNPASLAFQTVTVGSSKTLGAQVQNAGTAPLNVTGISSCAATPGSITWTPAAPFTVLAGGNVTLNVTFAPTAAGALPAGACLAIASNDQLKPTINLGVSGTATGAAGPAVNLEPASLDFQTVVIGAPRELTSQVHNAGNAALDLTSIALCNGTPATLSWTPSAPASVAPGASLSLDVFYTPAADGALPAGSCLVIATNDPANATVQLSISGAGSSGFTFELPIGCGSAGSTGSFAGLAVLLLFIARRRSSRAEELAPPNSSRHRGGVMNRKRDGSGAAIALALVMFAPALSCFPAAPPSTPGPPPGPPPGLYEPLSVPSSVGKVKNLLVGLPPTDAEIQTVSADPNALRGLVSQWVATPEHTAKLQSFFANAFQQSQVVTGDFADQLGDGQGSLDARLLANLRESFARTAVALVQQGAPFTATVTTRRFMLTPRLMALYAFMDAMQVTDGGSTTDLFQKANPGFQFTLTAKQGAIPLQQTLDPTSPNYMVWYAPQLAGAAYDPLCPQDPIVYNGGTGQPSISVAMFLMLNGKPASFSVGQHGCSPPAFPAGTAPLTVADTQQWQMVTVRQPSASETTTRVFDLPSFRAGADLVLRTPRVGFLTTPSFLAQWNTNNSNQARVTTNQTLIVALGRAMTPQNATLPPSLAALDQAHASQPACLACHQSLDPMRQFFRQQYSYYFHPQTNSAQMALSGSFGFRGVTSSGRTIFDLADQFAAHPDFAAAWTQKLCTWANSAPCLETDPEFVRVAGIFGSNFSWSALAVELFSSPLVSYAGPTEMARQSGQVSPVARREHLCAALSNRLAIPDACGLLVGTTVPRSLQLIVAILPSDQYSRGAEQAVLANDPNLFFRTGLENICASLAGQLVDAGSATRWSSMNPDAAISDFVHALMGIERARDTTPLTILQDHFQAAKGAGLSASDALKSTFALACLSPSVAGIGQ
ncbi:MAG: hypothetical protein AUG04_06225 [Deltaproteobacteria bacterium 13_1_20CM_2_69_21]|nr:MAG: hypothetical protein AUG04_06225 [Deltaproteobacteria bacterium 13_1_20CM_2_69_21]